MFNKLLTVLISIMLILSCFGTPCAFAAINMLQNGSFEDIEEDGKPVSWVAEGAGYGETFSVTEGEDGGNAVCLKGGGACYSKYINVASGTEYTLSMKIKNEKSLKVIIGYFDDGGKLGNDEIYEISTKSNKWVDTTVSFSARNGAKKISLKINGENACIDKLTLGKKGEDITEEYIFGEEINDSQGENLVLNGGFEDIENGSAKGWSYASQDYWDKNTTVTTEKAYSGKYSIKMSKTTDLNAYACYTVPVEAGVEYLVTSMYSTISTGAGMFVEWYNDNYISGETYITDFRNGGGLHTFENNNYLWSKAQFRIIPPEGCVMIAVYVCLTSPGEAYFDEVTCNKVGERVKGEMISLDAEFFYYTEWGAGEAYAHLNTTDHNFDNFGAVTFTIYDGDEVLYEGDGVRLDDRVKFKFNISLLSEKGKEYIMIARYKDKNGEVLEESSERIARYDRPTMLNENGQFQIEGKVKTMNVGTIIYGTDIYNYAPEMGLNVLSIDDAFQTNLSMLIQKLDERWEKGYMAKVVLYPDMKPAGHPDLIEKTKAAVEAIKDHPAIMMYMLMDEPGNSPERIEWLRAGYKAIRDIDPVHPCCIIECSANAYRDVGKCCDILGIDPYQGSDEVTFSTLTDALQKARVALDDKKPIVGVMRAFDGPTYKLGRNIMRYMPYTDLMAGIDILEWYSITTLEMKVPIWERPDTWEGIKDYASYDREDAEKLFLTGEYPQFNWGREEDVWWNFYIREGELYLVVLNKKNKEVSVSIPLKSYDGSTIIGQFAAMADDASGAETVTGNGTFNAQLKPLQVTKYKFKTRDNVDYSKLTGSNLKDIYDYSWAKTQIDTVFNKGIMKSTGIRTFSPGENITRADFTYALVKTLGLTAKASDNFSDIDGGHYYANEIAIAKALGIVMGTADNMFRPDVEISRQDMMTIIARAMKLSPQGSDMSSYPDFRKVSDYAKDSVAAMIESGLIKGNDEGNINPTGNATRAEAAVIMYRIMKK